jgi:hypothetical protein
VLVFLLLLQQQQQQRVKWTQLENLWSTRQ